MFNKFLIWIILILVPLLIYWQVTSFDYVWDDFDEVVDNPNLSFYGLSQIWRQPYRQLYIPVSYTLWTFIKIVNYYFGVDNTAFGYHLTSILLHIFNGLMVFAILKLMLGHKWGALAGALVFLVHPIQVEAVAWISETRGLLSASFGFSALYLYLYTSAREALLSTKKRFGLRTISSLLFGLALLAKPSAVVIPLLAFFIDLWLYQRPYPKIFMALFPWFLLFVPIAIITKSVQPGHDVSSFPFWLRPVIWLDAINFYCFNVLWPCHLAAIYHRTLQYVTGLWWTYLICLLPVVAGYMSWRYRKTWTIPALSVAVFIIGFLPVSGLVPFAFQRFSTVGDRYIYISMIGVALALGYLVSCRNNNLLYIAVSFLILVLGLRSYTVQIPTWQDNLTLWNHCLRISPKKAWIYNNRANAFMAIKEYQKAKRDFQQSIRLDPQYGDAYVGLGDLFLELQQYSQAIECYEHALQKVNNVRNRSLIYYKRGNIFYTQKLYNRALQDYTHAIRIRPGYFRAYNARGNVFFTEKQYNRAIQDYTQALKFQPFYSIAYTNRANALWHSGNKIQALQDYSQAIQTDPNNATTYYNRGCAFFQLARYQEALKDYEQAILMRPQYAEAHFNRGSIFFVQKLYREAIRDYTWILQNTDTLKNTYINRAYAYYHLHEYEKALQDINSAQQSGYEIDPEFMAKVRNPLPNK